MVVRQQLGALLSSIAAVTNSFPYVCPMVRIETEVWDFAYVYVVLESCQGVWLGDVVT